MGGVVGRRRSPESLDRLVSLVPRDSFSEPIVRCYDEILGVAAGAAAGDVRWHHHGV